MGVDTSISVGVGIAIPENVWLDYLKTQPEGYEDGDFEVLEALIEGEDEWLCCGFAGSYYDAKFNTPWIAVKRLTKEYDTYDIPGGLVGLAKPTITLEERLALERVAISVGAPSFEVGQFMSVLWH